MQPIIEYCVGTERGSPRISHRNLQNLRRRRQQEHRQAGSHQALEDQLRKALRQGVLQSSRL